MLKNLCCVFILLLISLQSVAGEHHKSNEHELDVVFCFDLSGSTNGLIYDLRDNLWHLINQAYLMEPRPVLRIALVGFSRPSFKKENAYVKVLSNLTSDFDYLAGEIGRIKPSIEKGDQYVGVAIKTCVSELNWSESPGAKKIIYIVGNGMVTTNNNDYVQACKNATEKNIIVNTIYVISNKSNKAKEIMGWYRIASSANGLSSEMSIGRREQINSNNMQQLFELSRDLNLTYVYYSKSGYERYLNFREADSLAFAGGNVAFYERAYFKNQPWFKGKNSSWDAVDYFTSTGLMPPTNDATLFPDTLESRTTEQLYDVVKELKSDRARVNSSLDFLLSEDLPRQMHQKFLNGELKDDNSFSRCVINILLKEWK